MDKLVIIISFLLFFIYSSVFIIAYTMEDRVKLEAKSFLTGKTKEEIQEENVQLEIDYQKRKGELEKRKSELYTFDKVKSDYGKYKNSLLDKVAKHAGEDIKTSATLITAKIEKKIDEKIKVLIGDFNAQSEAIIGAMVDDIAEQKEINADFWKEFIKSETKMDENTAIDHAFKLLLPDLDQEVHKVKGYYDIIVEKLVREIHIFSTANVVIFGSISFIFMFVSEKTKHAYRLCYILFGSSLFCMLCYFFLQDWTFSFIYGSFWSWLYIFSVSLLFFFVVDVIYFKGELTFNFLLEFFLHLLTFGVSS